MGATFESYKPVCSTQTNIAYSAVQRFRLYMMEYADRLMPKRYGSWASMFKYAVYSAEDRSEDYMDLMEEIENYGNGCSERIGELLRGVVAFCNHSDCDGVFYDDDCQPIRMVLEEMLAECDKDGNPYIKDELDRKRLEELRTVFASVSEGGFVWIR